MITEEIATQRSAPQRGSRLSRWQLAVIGAVVALAAGIGLVLGFSVLAPRANPLGGAASYLPADTVFYVEARLDQSPAQAQAMSALLKRFPAVKADKPLMDLIGSGLDQGLSSAGAPVSWANDIEPWFDGHVAIGMLDYPVAGMTTGNMTMPNFAVLFGATDPAAAGAFLDKVRAQMASEGSSLTSSQHAGATIWSLKAASGSQPPEAGSFAFAVAGDQVIVANGTSIVETLLDTHRGTQSFAGRPELQQLSAHLPADWTAFYAVDSAQIFAQLTAAMQQADPSAAALFNAYLPTVPTFGVATVSFASDALLFDAAGSVPAGSYANSRRDLASMAPPDALLFGDAGDVGTGLAKTVAALKGVAEAQQDGGQTKQMLDQAEAALGADLEDFVSWIGDGAVVAGMTGSTPYGGLILRAKDTDAATRRLGQLKSLLQLVAQSGGEQLRVSTDTVSGVEVTTISVKTGTATDVVPVPADVMVQYAMKDDTVLIGFGDQFVGRSLSLADGASLADADRFVNAVDRFGGANNSSVTFVDLAGLRTAVEGAVGADLPQEYTQQIQPNLVPFDYLVSVTQADGDAVVTHYGVVVK